MATKKYQAVSIAAIIVTTIATSVVAADLPSAAIQAPPSDHAAFAMPSLAGFYVRLGATALFTDPRLAATIAGAPLPGADLTIPPIVAPSIELGYFVRPHIAISIIGGYPPRVSSYGAGVLAPYGKLFTQVGGVALVTAHYHWDLGQLHPYLGGGVGRSISFHNSSSPLLQNFHAGDSFAPVFVVGADVALTDHVSVFFDMKKIWISQTATAQFQAAPGFTESLSAQVRTDPVVTTAGVGYTF